MKLGKYLKAAFLYHWNLLAFLGGLGFAVLSGHPDVVAPLVLAGEIAYLGVLGTHPKFQKYVDAHESREQQSDSSEVVDRILGSLPPKSVQRFAALRTRCQELQQIAQELRDPNRAGGTPAPLEELQLAGLDRLLWIYLRLLFTQHCLDRFLIQTTEQQIHQHIENLERQLQPLTDKDNPQQQRVRKSLEDNLETSRTRLANYRKAQDNSELVKLELDRLENKIRSLSEMAINRQEPDFISGQVDEVAGSLVQTERTMSELQFVTGLESADQATPELLRREMVQVRR